MKRELWSKGFDLRKNTPLIIIVFVEVILILAVVFLMNHVQNLLDSDVKINLTEIVTQNKDAISSKLKLEVNNLDLAAKQISERYVLDGSRGSEALRQMLPAYAKEKGNDRLSLASVDGIAMFPDGQELDISGRQYFRRAKQGNQNISERTVSRRDGSDIFIISVPIEVGARIIGTIQKQYTPQEMYDISSVPIFSEQGYMYIINSQGYILINSQQDKYYRESDNYFRTLYISDPDASKALEADIKENRSGFMETMLDGRRMFSAYTPIDDVYDWYLITSIPTSTVSPNAEIVIKMFYVVLVVVSMFFAFSMLYLFSLKNKQQQNLERVAFVDPVTGGNTFSKFSNDLQKAIMEKPDGEFYILSCDIDNFKYINSFYGFEAGDRILTVINNMFAECLDPGELVARSTGDHFVLMLRSASEARLERLFQSELLIDDIAVYLSAGLYRIVNPAESINLMIDKANMAAQKIKGKRYKRVEVFSEDYDQLMIKNEQTKRAVEQALISDEIIPFFQPKVDIDSGRLVGAEALARWKTSDGRIVPPGEFISVCEKTGLIIRVDLTILEKTLRFIRSNLDNGIECVPISVNFSRMHLLDQEFLNLILGKLQEYNVPPELIEIELTETVIFDNFQSISELINDMHKSGLKISMDDFGSGYSSLHMLKDVDIDVLKIDRGFLLDTENSDRQRTIFLSIVQMAEKLKIKVVVEGVENLQNIALMREAGCSVAQGFYYSRPIDEESFGKLYVEGKLCKKD